MKKKVLLNRTLEDVDDDDDGGESVVIERERENAIVLFRGQKMVSPLSFRR